jgi:hypothetical protein
MSPNAGVGEGCGVSANEYSLYRSYNSILTYGMLGPVKTMVVCDVGHRTVLDGRVEGLPLILYRKRQYLALFFNPILHMCLRDSWFTCDDFSTIEVSPLLFPLQVHLIFKTGFARFAVH